MRRFGIREGKLDEFVSGWENGVLPLRLERGFETIGAWVDAEAGEFIWLMSYAGPEPFEEADRAYYESAARADLDPDPAVHIETVQKAMVEPVV